MGKPVIGIVTNLMTVEEGPYRDGQRIYVNRDYVNCIIEAGGIPFLLPIHGDLAIIREQMRRIDGLLLSGGQDVSPHYYNEKPIPQLGAVLPDRDFFEMGAVKVAIETQKPIFGVCRGLQMMNIAFGGTLFQDIPTQVVASDLQHMQKEPRAQGTHEVDLCPSSNLFRILGKERLLTNSFHHQSIKDLAPSFVAVAKSRDGIIEAIERREGSFALGVQWHPEMMHNDCDMKKLFVAFVAASGER